MPSLFRWSLGFLIALLIIEMGNIVTLFQRPLVGSVMYVAFFLMAIFIGWRVAHRKEMEG